MHEMDLYGVLLPPLLVWAIIALAIRAVSAPGSASPGFLSVRRPSGAV